jgi:integrase
MAKRGQNEGSIFKRTDGRWCAQVNLGYVNGKRKRKYYYGDTRKEVQERLTKTLRDVQQGIPVMTGRQTVEQFLTRWLEESVKPSVRPGSARLYEQRAKNHLIPALGRIALDKLTPQHIQSFISQQRAANLSPTTINHNLIVLRIALNKAVKWGLVARNVVPLADAPRLEHKERRALTPEEARHFLGAAHGTREENLFLTMVTTGLRIGEARGLRWQDVDLEAGVLTVRYQIQRIAKKEQFCEPKTAGSRRMIALPAITVNALKRQHAACAADRLQAGVRWQDWALVFPGKDGAPFGATTLQRAMDRALATAGLPHLSPHALRHTAATFLAAANVNPRIAMDAMGHTGVDMTMTHYQHVTDTMRRTAAEGIQALLEGTA